jgi:hypothetical protein
VAGIPRPLTHSFLLLSERAHWLVYVCAPVTLRIAGATSNVHSGLCGSKRSAGWQASVTVTCSTVRWRRNLAPCLY